jgi:hypothetical protein
MPKHHSSKSKPKQNQQQEQQTKGWYCKEHNTKYLCDICKYEDTHSKRKETKYYFVSG